MCPYNHLVDIKLTSVVLLWSSLGSLGEVLDGGVSLDPVLLGQTLVDGGIDSAELDLALEFSGSLGPVGSEVLAMSAPRGKELHQPHVLRAKHQLLKVGLGQFDHLILARSC